MTLLNFLLQALTFMVLGGLALYGYLGLYTLVQFYRHRQMTAKPPIVAEAELPVVTVQLPVYNELYVVERLIRAAASLDYPRDRLQIQVLDDSEDRTATCVTALAEQYRRSGLQIDVVHRRDRRGYKAGALSNGLGAARGEYIAIFDADFEPPRDFLRNTVPYFLQDPELGLIQTRWGHLNEADSLLTAAQALALDKHFVMEQTVRFRARLFPKFNGTAGVWRRSCLEDAGGWHSDTVCEDLCLSTRAVLKGWGFHYLPDVVAPAELPASIMAYKNQQARWAKGSMQCLLKFGVDIWRDHHQGLAARLYALLTMAAYCTSLFLIILLLIQGPLLLLGVELPSLVGVFALAGVGQPLLFVLSQKRLYTDWKRRAWRLPGLMLIAIGLSATITRAVLEAVAGGRHVFVRTPKQGDAKGEGAYRLPFDPVVYAELFLALYALLMIVLALWQGTLTTLPFLISCALGFGIVARSTVSEQFDRGSMGRLWGRRITARLRRR